MVEPLHPPTRPRRDVDVVVDVLIKAFGNQPDVIQEHLANPGRMLTDFCTPHDFLTDPASTNAVRRWANECLAPRRRMAGATVTTLRPRSN